MKISELSDRSGVSIPSIKYYLREGLLPVGVATAANQASYSGAHVRRLSLIRALIDIGELPIASVRNVLRAVDSETTSLHDAFGAVMHGLEESAPAPDREVDEALTEVRRWVKRRKWLIHADAPALRSLTQLIVTLRRFGFPCSASDFDDFADHIIDSAEVGVIYARGMGDRAKSVETMVVGTVVYERAFTEVRRLALEAASARAERTPAQRRRH